MASITPCILRVDRHSDPAASIPFPKSSTFNLISADKLAQCMISEENDQTPTLSHPTAKYLHSSFPEFMKHSGYCGEMVSNAPAEV